MSTEETAVAETPANETVVVSAEKPVNKTKKKRGPNIPADVFVQVYNTSNTRDEVLAAFAAKGYTLTYGALISRASQYAEAGVMLKELDRKKTTGKKGKTLDVAGLNALAAEVLAAKAITNGEGETKTDETAAPPADAPAA